MLNENLVRIRKEHGLTQEALASKLNVVRQTVSKWEKGIAVPDADTLCKIANALEVSVSVLLGDIESEEKLDITSISQSLAQINEQLATRNRRTANIWKIISLVLIVAISFLIGQNYFGNKNKSMMLPDLVEVSNVCFIGNDKELTCSFVPSVGNENVVFTVSMYCNDNKYPTNKVISNYQDGVCTATFDKSKLTAHVDYSVVLNVSYNGDVRNLTITDVFSFYENDYTWVSKWNDSQNNID